jgi:hypothetical protein
VNAKAKAAAAGLSRKIFLSALHAPVGHGLMGADSKEKVTSGAITSGVMLFLRCRKSLYFK